MGVHQKSGGIRASSGAESAIESQAETETLNTLHNTSQLSSAPGNTQSLITVVCLGKNRIWLLPTFFFFFLYQWLEGTQNFLAISVPQNAQSHPESSLCLDALSPCSWGLTNEGPLSSTTSVCVFLIISRWSLLTLILTPVFKRRLFHCHTTEVTETGGGVKYCCSSVSHPEQPPSSFLKPPCYDPLTLVDTSCYSSL